MFDAGSDLLSLVVIQYGEMEKKKRKVLQLELFSEQDVSYISVDSYATFIKTYKDYSYIMVYLNLDELIIRSYKRTRLP